MVRKRDYENFVQIKESGKEGKSKLFENYTYRNNKWKCDPITFDDKEYIFCSFIESKFGKSAVLREEDMYHVQVNFWNVTFNNCNFENIYFEASRFWGCKFINCNFSEFGVVFDNCVFRNIEIEYDEK
ncbi:pentapeptide repeat-containing protein [Clostridium beijerinckii]|uniref:pentapeptide repeat-containing protein n=1 Tax=Clostridium beijerinckii TaxID=1520 RepID=UPI001A9B8D09|nr:pentapeptide repeat-containing protein [Clostridium beijerinckii]NSA58529.1 uncharacterized protein YjbI with pentapeptide repeats [Clostridium beijerinckii]